jgi:hypothetical protein
MWVNKERGVVFSKAEERLNSRSTSFDLVVIACKKNKICSCTPTTQVPSKLLPVESLENVKMLNISSSCFYHCVVLPAKKQESVTNVGIPSETWIWSQILRENNQSLIFFFATDVETIQLMAYSWPVGGNRLILSLTCFGKASFFDSILIEVN